MKNTLEKLIKNRIIIGIIFFFIGVLSTLILLNKFDLIEIIFKNIRWEYFIAIVSLLIGFFTIINSSKINKIQITSTIITGNRMDWIQKFREHISSYLTLVKYYEDMEITPNSLEKLYSLESSIKLHLNLFGKYDTIICDYIKRLNFSYSSLIHYVLIKKDNNSDIMSMSETFEMFIYINKYYEKIPDFVISKLISKEDEINFKNDEEIKKFIKTNEEKIYKINCNIFMKIKERWIKDIKHLSDLIQIYSQIYLKVEWDRVKWEAINGIKKTFDFDYHFEIYLSKSIDKIESIKKLLKVII